MDQPATKLARNASAFILFPIVGLLAGLLVGAIRVSIARMGEIDQIECVVRWGIAGFFLGLFLIVLLALDLRGKRTVSVRRLMAFIAIAGLLSWYVIRVLFGVIGTGRF